MNIPVGVLTRSDGEIELVFAMEAVAEPLWTEADLALITRGQAQHPDADCELWGCWCRWVEAGQTFHCANCADPFDILYQCQAHPRICPGCCGHPACDAAYRAQVRHWVA